MRIRKNWRSLLEQAVAKAGGNRSAISAASELNKTYLRDVLDRGQTPNLRSAEKLSDGLGIAIMDWFLQSDAAKRREVPVIDFVQAGDWTAVTDPYVAGQGFATISADTDVHPSAFALQIDGQSMATRFNEGDRIIVDPEVEPVPGDFVVAKADSEGAATFKQYRPRGRDGRGRPVVELRPLNDMHETLVLDARNPGRIVGTMIEHHAYRRAPRA